MSRREALLRLVVGVAARRGVAFPVGVKVRRIFEYLERVVGTKMVAGRHQSPGNRRANPILENQPARGR